MNSDPQLVNPHCCEGSNKDSGVSFLFVCVCVCVCVSACGPIEVELYKCFCIIVNSCIFVQVSPILSFDFAANKFIRHEPSLFPSLLILVQHGWYLSLHGVSSPVIGTS